MIASVFNYDSLVGLRHLRVAFPEVSVVLEGTLVNWAPLHGLPQGLHLR